MGFQPRPPKVWQGSYFQENTAGECENCAMVERENCLMDECDNYAMEDHENQVMEKCETVVNG